jgi:hypothetical protein
LLHGPPSQLWPPLPPLEPEPDPDPELAPDPDPELDPELDPDPDPELDPELDPDPDPEPDPELELKPASEPNGDPRSPCDPQPAATNTPNRIRNQKAKWISPNECTSAGGAPGRRHSRELQVGAMRLFRRRWP